MEKMEKEGNPLNVFLEYGKHKQTNIFVQS